MRFKKYKKIKISLTNLNLNNKEITKNNFGKMAETKKTFFNKFKSFYGLKPEISNLRADCSKVHLTHKQERTDEPSAAVKLSMKISILHHHLSTLYTKSIDPEAIRMFFRTLNNIRSTLKSFIKRQAQAPNFLQRKLAKKDILELNSRAISKMRELHYQEPHLKYIT